jgi:hypothetical protein
LDESKEGMGVVAMSVFLFGLVLVKRLGTIFLIANALRPVFKQRVFANCNSQKL